VKKERKYLPGYEIEEQDSQGNFAGLNISHYENRNFEDTGVTPQKAKFFFCALQKFARKSLWSTVIKRIQHYNSTNSKCNDPYLRQQTSTYHQSSTSYYTKTYEREEDYFGGHHHEHDDHENHDLSMDYTNLISDFGGPRNTVSSKNYASNTRPDGKSISYSYILSEVQNDTSMVHEGKNESYLRVSTVETDPNKRLVTNAESEQQFGEEYIYEGLTGEDEFIVTMGRHNNSLLQRAKNKLMEMEGRPAIFMDGNEALSTEITKASDQEQVKKLKEKNSKLFSLLMKKSLETAVKRSLEIALMEIKVHAEEVEEETEWRESRKLELLESIFEKYQKGVQRITLEHWRKVSKDKTKDLVIEAAYDSLEYSYRTISPSHRPTTDHVRQKSIISDMNQNSFEVSLNERKIRLQFMCIILKKDVNFTLGDAFKNIQEYSQERYKRILSKRFAEIMENLAEKKLEQNYFLSFKALQAEMKHKRDLEEKEKIYKITQHYRALALNQPLQKISLRLKSEAFNTFKGLAIVEKETAKYKEDLMRVKSLNKKTAQFANILQNCQRINQKYEDYCSTSGKKSNKSMEDHFTSPCKENNKENFTHKTPLFDRTNDAPKRIQVAHPKYKFMIEALETVYNNRLKSSFNLIKRTSLTSELKSTKKLDRFDKPTPRTFKAETSTLTASTLKVQSLLDSLKRETKVEQPSQNYESESSFDLQSAINFLKAL